MNQELQSLNF